MEIRDFQSEGPHRWVYPRGRDSAMTVDACVFASEEILGRAVADGAIRQVLNVASLPGVISCSLAMPDIHFGYGFCIGGVAAFDAREGIVLPGGVGYDINCGVRLVATSIPAGEIRRAMEPLGSAVLARIPTGVGTRSLRSLSKKQFERVLRRGARMVVEEIAGDIGDLDFIESGGALAFSDPGVISPRALTRGRGQLGSLGAGNHFIEFEVVTDIFDPPAAAAFGISPGQVVIMIHTGSRGFGHQVATDYIERIRRKNPPVDLKDKQLIYARIGSPEGRDYRAALNGASNFAWANRHLIMEDLIAILESYFHSSRGELGIRLVYDQAHNIAKEESHSIGGRSRSVLVHRKGATRAFPPGHPSLPDAYRAVGQPVIIPGSMGEGSYLLRGTREGMALAFGTAPHGAGRSMSRKQALHHSEGRDIPGELDEKGIRVLSHSSRGIREEMPAAYKSIDEVVRVTAEAGLAARVARMKPLLVIKG